MDGMSDKELRDGLIVAYVDGELDAAHLREIETLLENDPEARALADAFRQSALLAKQAYAGMENEPVPARLIDTVMKIAPPAGAEVVAFAPKSARAPILPTGGLRRALMPLAASVVALMAGFSGGMLFQADRGGPAAIQPASAPVPESEELFESALIRALAIGQRNIPVPYRNSQAGELGRVTLLGPAGNSSFAVACEVFERQVTAGQTPATSRGIACRSGKGWDFMTLSQN